MKAGWTLDDIPWDRFDRDKVDPELVKLVKAAALVEHNGADYTEYLCNVFSDDPEFQASARKWGEEETLHGKALAKWAGMVDPTFDFETAFQRFLDGYRLPLDATESVRGTRSGELVARCIVETGTSSFYSAVAEASEEPVLSQICRAIAADEFRHYKLFYDTLRTYLDREGLGRIGRFRVAVGRINETEDDELAYAYFCANAPENAPYDRKRWSEAYMARACGFYDRKHIDRGAAMIAKAAGLNPQNRIIPIFSRLAYGMMRRKHARYKGDAAAA